MQESKERLPHHSPTESAEGQLIGWVERSRTLIFTLLGAAVLAVGGYFAFRYYKSEQEHNAQREMFQAVYYFEQDSLRAAVEGDGNNLGFEQIINDYGITETANLARYYTGAAKLKLGKFEEAIAYLEDFDSGDALLSARAYSLIGDAHMELKRYEDAASYYGKAASYKPNALFTPTYLLKEALAHEKLQRPDDAIAAYQKIVDHYRESSAFSNAQELKARLQKVR